MSGALAELIAARLASGPIPAAEVMALALYHPEHGYYRRAEGPWGFEGKDYYTALDCGPLLGEAVARRLEGVWEELGRPSRFTVLEAGAGRGWLGRDLLAAAQGPFASALRYLHRDNNPAARRAAEEALASWLAAGQARFVSEAETLDPFLGAVVSNELFDALPAQPWRWSGEGWEREVLTSAGSAWQRTEPGAAGAWFSTQAELEPGDGSVWAEGLPALAGALAGCLAQGLFLAIDYGDSAARLLAKGADLRRYRGHTVDGNWWEGLGEADLTADVDFTHLGAVLETHGLAEISTQSLGRWVREHGPLAQWEAQWQELDAALRMRCMENLLALTLPGMMGDRFKVLEAWRR